MEKSKLFSPQDGEVDLMEVASTSYQGNSGLPSNQRSGLLTKILQAQQEALSKAEMITVAKPEVGFVETGKPNFT